MQSQDAYDPDMAAATGRLPGWAWPAFLVAGVVVMTLARLLGWR